MDIINELLKKSLFYTDIKSMLRGLNSLDGSSQQRVRAIRVDLEGNLYKTSSIYTLVRLALICNDENSTKLLQPDIKVLKYDDTDNSISFLKYLSGDSKEILLLKDNLKAKEFLSSIITSSIIRPDYCFYSDLYSACLDSYLINNGIIFLFHPQESQEAYIVNRAVTPDPNRNYESFLFYTKLFKLIVPNKPPESINFIQLHRKDLTIQFEQRTCDADLSQMIIPVVHLFSLH